MEFKGTKGKWKLGVVPDYNDTLKSAMLEIQSDSYWICKVQNNGMIGSVEGKANALLMSKSREMLELIEELSENLELQLGRLGCTLQGDGKDHKADVDSYGGSALLERSRILIKEATKI